MKFFKIEDLDRTETFYPISGIDKIVQEDGSDGCVIIISGKELRLKAKAYDVIRDIQLPDTNRHGLCVFRVYDKTKD